MAKVACLLRGQALVERLRETRPIAVRLKRATERRERLHKRAVGLKDDIDLLKEGLKVRHVLLRQVLEQIEAEDVWI